MTDFNQRGQKVNRQYNAETINFNNEGEHSSDSQKTYLVNCRSCGQLIEVAYPYVNVPLKNIGVDYHPAGVIDLPGNTYLTCPHCKTNLAVHWYR